MYNLTECIDAFSKKSGSIWQKYRDNLALYNNGNIIDFSAMIAIIVFHSNLNRK